MIARLFRLAGLALALAIFSLAPAAALDEPELNALRDVIARQLEAFRRNDAPAAYAFAAPSIRRMFPSEDRFMEMVRQGYPGVARNTKHRFGEFRETGEGPAQIVDIIDETGTAWRALYTFEKQPDGNWRITGCYVVRAPGEST